MAEGSTSDVATVTSEPRAMTPRSMPLTPATPALSPTVQQRLCCKDFQWGSGRRYEDLLRRWELLRAQLRTLG